MRKRIREQRESLWRERREQRERERGDENAAGRRGFSFHPVFLVVRTASLFFFGAGTLVSLLVSRLSSVLVRTDLDGHGGHVG